MKEKRKAGATPTLAKKKTGERSQTLLNVQASLESLIWTRWFICQTVIWVSGEPPEIHHAIGRLSMVCLLGATSVRLTESRTTS